MHTKPAAQWSFEETFENQEIRFSRNSVKIFATLDRFLSCKHCWTKVRKTSNNSYVLVYIKLELELYRSDFRSLIFLVLLVLFSGVSRCDFSGFLAEIFLSFKFFLFFRYDFLNFYVWFFGTFWYDFLFFLSLKKVWFSGILMYDFLVFDYP